MSHCSDLGYQKLLELWEEVKTMAQEEKIDIEKLRDALQKIKEGVKEEKPSKESIHGIIVNEIEDGVMRGPGVTYRLFGFSDDTP